MDRRSSSIGNGKLLSLYVNIENNSRIVLNVLEGNEDD